MRDDNTSNKASFRNLKSCPKEKKRRDRNFCLIKCKHTVNQDKKNLRYNFLQTSKLIIDCRNGMLAREPTGPTDDHVSEELLEELEQWQKNKLNL